jgi:hypothetical protein
METRLLSEYHLSFGVFWGNLERNRSSLSGLLLVTQSMGEVIGGTVNNNNNNNGFISHISIADTLNYNVFTI